jgi:hypothetical protein
MHAGGRLDSKESRRDAAEIGLAPVGALDIIAAR